MTVTPKYYELTPYQQEQVNRIIDEISLLRYHDEIIDSIVKLASETGQGKVVLSLTVPEVKWLMGCTYTQDGIGSDIYYQAKRSVWWRGLD